MTQPPDEETTAGKYTKNFPTTHWDKFITKLKGSPQSQETALEYLAQTYWKPVYAYVRFKWAKTIEEAKDLTQEFFLWLVDKKTFQKMNIEKKKFRALLKVLLNNFLTGEYRKERRIKRGGREKFINLSFSSEEINTLELQKGGDLQPEDILDRAWKDALYTRALSRMKEEAQREDKENEFLIFQEYFLEENSEQSYAALEEKYGLNRIQLSNLFTKSKKRFREFLVECVAETVEGEDNLQEELISLFGNPS